MKPEPVTDQEVQNLLAGMSGWEIQEGQLVKTFTFSSYLAGIDFVQQLAVKAEAMNHHPDMLVLWRKVKVSLTTHSAKAITNLDFDLARQADALT